MTQIKMGFHFLESAMPTKKFKHACSRHIFPGPRNNI